MTAQELLAALDNESFGRAHPLWWAVTRMCTPWRLFGTYYGHIYDYTEPDAIYLRNTKRPGEKGWKLTNVVQGLEARIKSGVEEGGEHLLGAAATAVVDSMSVSELAALTLMDPRFGTSWMIRKRLLAGV